jgi:sugar fermentation stimulation protein A
MEGERFDLARDIDPAYGRAFERALARGVEVLVYGCAVNLAEIVIERRLAFASRA